MTRLSSLAVAITICMLPLTAAQPDALPLGPHGAPGSEARVSEPEKLDDTNVLNVHNPSITPFWK